MLSTAHAERESPFDLGDTIDIGHPWIKGSKFRHLVLTRPYPFGPTFARFNRWTAGSSWTNYSVTTELRSSDNDTLGVMFRYTSTSNYYRFSMDAERSQRRLTKVRNGTWTTLWNEQRHIKTGNRDTIRNPPGKDLAHERGREAAKGYSYKHSNLQDRSLHRLQHKFDDFGRKNKERPPK